VPGVEVLDDDDRGGEVTRQVTEDLGQGGNATGRRRHGDHVKSRTGKGSSLSPQLNLIRLG